MSVSKWRYSPAECDDRFCIGDCDLCPFGPDCEDEDVDEQD